MSHFDNNGAFLSLVAKQLGELQKQNLLLQVRIQQLESENMNLRKVKQPPEK